MWGYYRPTPAHLRGDRDAIRCTPSAPLTPPLRAQRPALSPDTAGDAAGDWLAHLDAGRIAVR